MEGGRKRRGGEKKEEKGGEGEGEKGEERGEGTDTSNHYMSKRPHPHLESLQMCRPLLECEEGVVPGQLTPHIMSRGGC